MVALDTPIHTLVLDAGPLIKNEPSISTLTSQSQRLVTIPSVIEEIRDQATRARIETLLRPFLVVRNPKPDSIKFIEDFARRTGDLSVLSRPDIHLLALTYELECEQNSGDWRLRRVPGQKRLNGSPPPLAANGDATQTKTVAKQDSNDENTQHQGRKAQVHENTESLEEDMANLAVREAANAEVIQTMQEDQASTRPAEPAAETVATSTVQEKSLLHSKPVAEDGSESDSEGWITPSNIKRYQAEDNSNFASVEKEVKTLQAALLTSDFAMQNVALQINLNLVSSSLKRVRTLKTYILRCHACFMHVKDMTKQFCPRCGKPTLTRVACSTNEKGEFKLHLKKTMQWNTRGDRFSIPKPVPGSANGRVGGGGKGGWGNGLILAEDQKEYIRAMSQQKRSKERDLMDDDYLPSILSGDRSRQGGRLKVGAGRNVNSKKR